jgi:hypothetical protein
VHHAEAVTALCSVQGLLAADELINCNAFCFAHKGHAAPAIHRHTASGMQTVVRKLQQRQQRQLQQSFTDLAAVSSELAASQLAVFCQQK